MSSSSSKSKAAAAAVDSSSGSSSSKHSVLDRSIPIVLPMDADKDTPSRKQGVSVQLERLHRLHGTSLISMGIHILQQQQQQQQPESAEAAATTAVSSYSPTSWFASSCTIFHRFFHGASLTEKDVWSVAMASTLIAAKLEEIQLTVRQLIIVYAHLYTRRRHCVMTTASENDSEKTKQDNAAVFQKIVHHPQVVLDASVSSSERNSRHRLLEPSSVQALSPMGPVWKEWHETLLQTENSILRQLGFVIHWIPNRHVHKFLHAFLHVLQLPTTSASTAPTGTSNNASSNLVFAQRTWYYCNMSYRLDLCVRFEASVIACAAIHLAALDLGYNVDDLRVVKSLSSNTATKAATSHPWWRTLLLVDDDDDARVQKAAHDLIQIANAILGLATLSSGESNNIDYNDNDNDKPCSNNQLDVLVASVAFLKPLNQDSFHGPDSFLWEMANQHATSTTAVAG